MFYLVSQVVYLEIDRSTKGYTKEVASFQQLYFTNSRFLGVNYSRV